MPGGDGTGPMGQSPRTGGASGNCRSPQSAGSGRRRASTDQSNEFRIGMGPGRKSRRNQRGIRGNSGLKPSR